MSVSTLFAQGRQFNANLHANSLTLTPMTTTERDDLVPEEAKLAYDTTLNQLAMYANGVWNTIDYVPPTGKFFALWTTNAIATVPNTALYNPCNQPIAGNALVRAQHGGASVSPAGVIVVPKDGVYKVEGNMLIRPATRLTAGSVRMCICNFNGSAAYATVSDEGFNTPNTVSLSAWTMHIAGFIPLVAGASIAIHIKNDATGQNINVETNSTDEELTTWFSIEYVTN